MDCGPNYLYMIGMYYVRIFLLEKIRELKIGKEWVNLLGISGIAEKIGF